MDYSENFVHAKVTAMCIVNTVKTALTWEDGPGTNGHAEIDLNETK
jgi:hypothetical protein